MTKRPTKAELAKARAKAAHPNAANSDYFAYVAMLADNADR